MKDQDQIVAIAELDGYGLCPSAGCDYRKCDHWHKDGFLYFPEPYSRPMLPQYLTSRDAIVPVREKICEDENIRKLWCENARMILHRRIPHVNNYAYSIIRPDEDSEALLRAIGKWVE